MKRINYLMASLFAAAVLASCGGDKEKPDPTPKDDIKVSTGAITMNSDGGTESFDVTATGPWTITADDASAIGTEGWVTVTPMLGQGGTQADPLKESVEVNIDPNLGTTDLKVVLTVTLNGTNKKKTVTITSQKPEGGEENKYQYIHKYEVLVEGSSFNMGSPYTGEQEDATRRLHPVAVSDFYMCQYESTQGEFERVMGFNPATNGGENPAFPTHAWYVDESYPVVYAMFYQICDFANKLSIEEGLEPYYNIPTGAKGRPAITIPEVAGKGYRLPTEAEWEWAAQGGVESEYTLYPGFEEAADADAYVWSADNAVKDGKTGMQTVGTKLPNPLGLYDMAGNAWEQCWDFFGDYPETDSEEVLNPFGPNSGSAGVQRGGSWFGSLSTNAYPYTYFARLNMPDIYTNSDEDRGFRLVRYK